MNPPSAASPHATGKAPGVSERIEIWWSGDRAYYPGVVSSANSDGTHKVTYDDGEIESVDLRLEAWRHVPTIGRVEVKEISVPSAPPPTRRRRRKPNSAYAKLPPDSARNSVSGPDKNSIPLPMKSQATLNTNVVSLALPKASVSGNVPAEEKAVGKPAASSPPFAPAVSAVATAPSSVGVAEPLEPPSFSAGVNGGTSAIKKDPRSAPGQKGDWADVKPHRAEENVAAPKQERLAISPTSMNQNYPGPTFPAVKKSVGPGIGGEVTRSAGEPRNRSMQGPRTSKQGVAPTSSPTRPPLVGDHSSMPSDAQKIAGSASARPHMNSDAPIGTRHRTLASAAPLAKPARESLMDVKGGNGSATDTDDEGDSVDAPLKTNKRRPPSRVTSAFATQPPTSAAAKRRRSNARQPGGPQVVKEPIRGQPLPSHAPGAPEYEAPPAHGVAPGPGVAPRPGAGPRPGATPGVDVVPAKPKPDKARDAGLGDLGVQENITGGSREVSGRELLPLDHVMTAVVQATVMILDQRLRPIADRLDALSDEVRQSRGGTKPASASAGGFGGAEREDGGQRSGMGVVGRGSLDGLVRPPGGLRVRNQSGVSPVEQVGLPHLAEIVQNQHAEHVDQIDRMRKDLKKLRSEHRDVLVDTLAMKEAELKRYVDSAVDRVVHNVSQGYEQATQRGHIPVPASSRMYDIYGASQNRNCSASDGMPAFYSGGPSAQYGAGPSPRHGSSLSNGQAGYAGVENTHVGPHEQIFALVARAVSTWILETQHECPDGAEKSMWADHTATSCLYNVAKQLRAFRSFGDAMSSLSMKLSEENAELAWFAHPENRNAMQLARRNYSAWDPPPSDEEWSCELVLLTVLANRFHSALQQCGQDNDHLVLAISAAELAAVSNGAQISR